MDSRHKETLSVAEQAAEWMLIMESPSAEERAAFWNWLESSPLHVRELILAVKTQRRLRGFDRTRELDVNAILARVRSNIAHIGTPADLEPQRSPKTRWFYAAAACLALITIGAAGYWTFWESRNTYSTAIGQQLVFELDDGSVVYLNTDSRMKVRFSEQARDVFLASGQALFEVKHDRARPFRVHTASSIVEAVGTQFDVRVLGNKTLVSVVEGVVRVLQPEFDSVTIKLPEPPRLAAGEAATVDDHGKVERTAKVDVTAVSAWKQQRLIFNEETLGWIADEFNRYNATPRLRIEGDALRAQRFNGVFNAHSPESLVEYLQEYLHGDPSIVFERTDDEIVIRQQTNASAQRLDATP
ncbi:MAG TPA: FecR domain-containing protein [Steroidobacteraceae bacterium]|jgi:transmembrane sensor